MSGFGGFCGEGVRWVLLRENLFLRRCCGGESLALFPHRSLAEKVCVENIPPSSVLSPSRSCGHLYVITTHIFPPRSLL